MAAYSCPCGTVIDQDDPKVFLATVDSHDCVYHPAVRSTPEPASKHWAGVVETLLFVVLVIGLCIACGVVWR